MIIIMWDVDFIILTTSNEQLTTAFSCGAPSAFKLKEQDYLRSMLWRRQLQGFVMLSVTISQPFAAEV